MCTEMNEHLSLSIEPIREEEILHTWSGEEERENKKECLLRKFVAVVCMYVCICMCVCVNTVLNSNPPTPFVLAVLLFTSIFQKCL